MKKALETDADIVVSKFVINRLASNLLKCRTMGNYAIESLDLSGVAILDDFFKTLGTTSHRFLVWNKIYKKSLWDRCYPDLAKLKRHQVMLEDFIFGVHFMSKAMRYVSVDCDAYFYAKHEESSTASDMPFGKFLKYIEDIFAAFEFNENYLRRIGKLEGASGMLLHARAQWRSTWSRTVNRSSLRLSEKRSLLKRLSELSSDGSIEKSESTDAFFYRENTVWNGGFEKLKKDILSPDVECVSFDVFDTLLLRPLYTPKDLFRFLDGDFIRITGDKFASFHDARVSCEGQARLNCPTRQDIAIEGIYEALGERYNLSEADTNFLLERELSLELEFSAPRGSILEIFELARFAGKKIIIISDMYLPGGFIAKLLEKNGYAGYDKLYVSSDTGLSKSTGDLYKYAVKDAGLDPNRVLHIGDNWQSDVVRAKDAGFGTCFVPSPMSLLLSNAGNLHKRGIIAETLRTNHPGSYIGRVDNYMSPS
jgi:HAD superfamily hydrolase (TIGR01549 family)